MDGSTCVCCGGPGCERAVVYGVIVRVKMRRRRVTHRSQLGCCGMAVCRRASQTRESAMVLAPGCVATNQACRSEFFSFTPLEGLRHRTSPPSGWRVGPSTQPPARRGDTLPVQRHPRTVATATDEPRRRRQFPLLFCQRGNWSLSDLAARGGRTYSLQSFHQCRSDRLSCLVLYGKPPDRSNSTEWLCFNELPLVHGAAVAVPCGSSVRRVTVCRWRRGASCAGIIRGAEGRAPGSP